MSVEGFHHWRDGVYFRREESGAVLIRIFHPYQVDHQRGRHEREICIPPDEWCSIVAAVSASGEDSATYQVARRLHGGGPDE